MKGINFTEPLFHTIVEGLKTQTRRIIKPQPQGCFVPTKEGYQDGHFHNFKPRYKLGETVYIKEPYLETRETYPSGKTRVLYKYSGTWFDKEWKWNNKLFMPEKYARYFIEITAVHCERLQDISDEDCLKEGIEFNKFNDPYYFMPDDNGCGHDTPREAYADLINKIYGKGTWESNPYVFVYDFKLLNNK